MNATFINDAFKSLISMDGLFSSIVRGFWLSNKTGARNRETSPCHPVT